MRTSMCTWPGIYIDVCIDIYRDAIMCVSRYRFAGGTVADWQFTLTPLCQDDHDTKLSRNVQHGKKNSNVVSLADQYTAQSVHNFSISTQVDAHLSLVSGL